MNIVEKEAISFHSDSYQSGFYGGTKIPNLYNLQAKLTNKLYKFSRDRDKLDFLKILRQKAVDEIANHNLKCTNRIW